MQNNKVLNYVNLDASEKKRSSCINKLTQRKRCLWAMAIHVALPVVVRQKRGTEDLLRNVLTTINYALIRFYQLSLVRLDPERRVEIIKNPVAQYDAMMRY